MLFRGVLKLWAILAQIFAIKGHEQQKLVVEQPRLCTSAEDSGISNFVFLVHSSSENYGRRQVVRQTWASVAKTDPRAKVLFVMGHKAEEQKRQKSLRNPKMDPSWDLSRLQREAALHKDMLVGDFIEHQRNDSLKHLLSLSWLQENCLSANSATTTPFLIVKMDDNVFVEIYHLFQFVQAVYGGRKALGPRSLMCDVIQSVDAENGVRRPDYCRGSAFMMTPDLIQPIIEAALDNAGKLPREDDDLFVTGYLREKVGGVVPLYLSPRYTYDKLSIQKWLSSQNGVFPFLFANVDASDSDMWSATMRKLWKKTKFAHALDIVSEQD